MLELITAKGSHVANDEDSLLVHRYHMTPQTPSWVMVVDNFKRLVPNCVEPKVACSWNITPNLEYLESNKAIRYKSPS
jgi:hypothetical protein